MDVRTRGGVFGPGGYGGGIFDGSMSISGLGMTGAVMQAQAGLGDNVWSWMNKASDPNLVRFQVAINKELSARGFKTIGTDGQLGPGTCGALSWLGTLTDVDFSANPDLSLASLLVSPDGGATTSQGNPCKGITYPTKVGSTVPFKPPSTFSDQLPWGTYDARTASMQNDLNGQLDGHGYNTIGTTGTLDAATCGAMKLASDMWGVDFMSAYGGNCQAFTAPSRKAAVTPVTPAPGPVTPVGPVTPAVRHTSTTAWMVGGLLGAAVVGSLYAVSKKKKRKAA